MLADGVSRFHPDPLAAIELGELIKVLDQFVAGITQQVHTWYV